MIALESLRASGRTTRMLAEAKRQADSGKEVWVITATAREAVRMRATLNDPRIHFESSHQSMFDWDTLRLAGIGGEAVVLVDHWAIENKYRRLLEMLHRFDG